MPSLRYAFVRWSSTVRSVTKSACAMPRLARPRAAIAATPRSLPVSASTPLLAARRGHAAGPLLDAIRVF
jgi:hypothetical protein